MGNLTSALESFYAKEGGLNTNEPTGDKSFKGVRSNVYSQYLKNTGRPEKDVETITDVERQQFFQDEFFNRLTGIKSDKLLKVMFDFSANSGPSRAIKILQLRVGAKPDGIIGEKTLKSIEKYGEEKLADDILQDRYKYIQGLKNKSFQEHKQGVLNRVKGMMQNGNDKTRNGN